MQGILPWEAGDAIPSCVGWDTGTSDEWTSEGMSVDALGLEGDAGRFGRQLTCRTLHLSAFAYRNDEITADWNTVDLLGDFDVLLEVCLGWGRGRLPTQILTLSGTCRTKNHSSLVMKGSNRVPTRQPSSYTKETVRQISYR